MKRKTLWLILAAILILSLVGGWFLFRPRPIRVGLVGFPSFMTTRMVLSVDSKNAEVVIEDDMADIGQYDALVLWGMGAKWTDEDRARLEKLGEKGKPFVVMAPTNPQNNLTSLSEEQTDLLLSYFSFGGVKNYRSAFNYIRSELLGKKLREGTVEPPIEYGEILFFGKTDDEVFDSYEDYQQYYQTHGYREGAPRVALLFGLANPFNSNRHPIDEMISAYEAEGFAVYPFSAGTSRVELLRSIDPDLVVYLPHGRVAPGTASELEQFLSERNIPILTALTVMTSKEKWEADPQGLTGGFLGQSVAVPELDGAMLPYALISLEKDEESGFELFRTMPERLNQFVEISKRYVALQKKANSEKRLAIFYFKGPGENSLVAQGLETLPSLYNLLCHLQREGYNVGDLPTDEKAFEARIKREGRLFNSYAEGALAKFIADGYPQFVATEELTDWLQRTLTPEQLALLEKQYGPVPGESYRMEQAGKSGLAVTRVRFGNIVLMPQPGQGAGPNDFRAVHGANPIPPYPYVAAYLWAQHGFAADALIHIGTHGSLEFINGKQVALSNQDWTDRLVSTLPHVYYYTIANVGEGIIAKRRSYAQLVSYLAPPFMATELSGEVREFLSLCDNYLSKEEDDAELAKKIATLAIAKGYPRDLRFDWKEGTVPSRGEIETLADFAEELATSRIPGGMYVAGVAFPQSKISKSVELLSIEPVAHALAELDVAYGRVTRPQLQSERFFGLHYRQPAQRVVARMVANPSFSVEQALRELGISAQQISDAKETLAAIEAEQKARMEMMRSMRPQAARGIKKKSGGGHPSFIPKVGERPEHTKTPEESKKTEAAPQKPEMPSMPTVAPERRVWADAYQHLISTLECIPAKRKALEQSPQLELQAMSRALAGGFTPPSPGGDYLANPEALPTGRNLYAVNAEATPSAAAEKKGKEMAEALLKDYAARHDGALPQKVSFTLWSSSFIESEGATVAEILYLLGCRPVRDPMGRVQNVELIPREELGRPRIDVVVQTSGQLRDIAASRLVLLQRAVEMAAAVDEGDNLVAAGAVEAERMLVESGIAPKEARRLSTRRVFGGVNGNYGTGIQGMVESGDKWEERSQIAEVYLNNMGAFYGDNDDWGSYAAPLFKAALAKTDIVVQPRQSNTWGALSLDHVYEFMGGLTLAVEHVTGKEPEGYFNDLRNRHRTRVTELKQSVGVEARTTILNPAYLREQIKEGEGAANALAETIRNTYGWNVMKPSAIDKELWDEIYNTLIEDEHKLGVQEFFQRENPAALQELTAVMLETVRKGMWEATPEQVARLSEVHAASIEQSVAGCSGFVCDNAKLRSFIADKLPEQARDNYKQSIEQVREVGEKSGKAAQRLSKEQDQRPPVDKSSRKSTYIIIAVVVLLILGIVVATARNRKRSKKA